LYAVGFSLAEISLSDFDTLACFLSQSDRRGRIRTTHHGKGPASHHQIRLRSGHASRHRGRSQGRSYQESVWQQLHEHNPALGYKEFCVYLVRLRKRTHQPTALTGEEKAPAVTLTLVSHSSPPEFDPLANVRRAEANRSGFHYRGTEDLHELVYGTKKNCGKQF